MALFEIKDLSFKYPEKEKKAVDNISLSIEEGEFISICGRSGSGKSTLLRQLKPSLTPFGTREGIILYRGKDIGKIDGWDDVKIGYVFQNPDNQIVTDKVWHELAFALENIGMDREDIRLRVGEMASFFGIQHWFYMDTKDLSGGQKQILNLASVMAMDPDILILDEPTSQLDPIATRDFLDMLKRINDDLGTTILISEHRLEDLLALSERLIAMEEGRIIYDGGIRESGDILRETSIFTSLPTAIQLYYGLDGQGTVPINVKEARSFLKGYSLSNRKFQDGPREKDSLISIRECFFRYDKEGKDIVRDLNLDIERGTIHSILGGNGTGKSTSLLLMANVLKPYRGRIRVAGKRLDKTDYKIAMLPQDPQSIFIEKTVREEVYNTSCDKDKLRELVDFMELGGLLDYHPYDLSGGEAQRLGLLKLLAKSPDILLLDEITKGLDGAFKDKLGRYLRELSDQGATIVMVSHDLEFCADFSHRASLFFDGSVISTNSTRDFFSGNNFYTTKTNRIVRDYNNKAISLEDVIDIWER